MEGKLNHQDNQDSKILALLKDTNSFEHGFRLLVETHSERVYWQIRRMVHSHDDADDVLQNVLVKVFKSIRNFKGDSKLYTWLHRIAMNESITFLNKRKKRLSASLDEPESIVAHTLRADSYFDGNEVDILLQAALATLPDRQREVFNLRYFDEMPYKEMAELMNLSEGALKASYHHAAKKIEQYIKSH